MNGVVDLELWQVRRELEHLCALRLRGPFDDDQAFRFDALCRRERELLTVS